MSNETRVRLAALEAAEVLFPQKEATDSDNRFLSNLGRQAIAGALEEFIDFGGLREKITDPENLEYYFVGTPKSTPIDEKTIINLIAMLKEKLDTEIESEF